MFSEATQDPEIFFHASIRVLWPLLSYEYRVSWAFKPKITTLIFHKQAKWPFIYFFSLSCLKLLSTLATYTKVLSSRPSHRLFSLQPWLTGAFSSPLVLPHTGLCKTPPIFISFLWCTAAREHLQRGTPRVRKSSWNMTNLFTDKT